MEGKTQQVRERKEKIWGKLGRTKKKEKNLQVTSSLLVACLSEKGGKKMTNLTLLVSKPVD